MWIRSPLKYNLWRSLLVSKLIQLTSFFLQFFYVAPCLGRRLATNITADEQTLLLKVLKMWTLFHFNPRRWWNIKTWPRWNWQRGNAYGIELKAISNFFRWVIEKGIFFFHPSKIIYFKMYSDWRIYKSLMPRALSPSIGNINENKVHSWRLTQIGMTDEWKVIRSAEKKKILCPSQLALAFVCFKK